MRFARLFVQGRHVGTLAAEFVMIIPEGDGEAVFLVVTDDVVQNELVEAVDVIDETTEHDAGNESDRVEVGHDANSFVL